MMKSGIQRAGYRADIDGLRALAVFPVVLFHAGFPWFPGGYVGVDVFFVISGYLITGLLHEEMLRSEFDIARFYDRRIRRIFPALFVTLLACSLIALVLFIPQDLVDFGKSSVAAALSMSNFLFWRETGYFDAPASLKPLLHTWSLGVEEQFYIFFPLLLAVIYRRAENFYKPVILTLALLSFAMSVWGVVTHPEAAYYLLPCRAWELLTGSLLAIGVIPTLRNSSICNLAAVCGLLLILIPVFVYTEETPFPGAAALGPALGAAMIIHSGHADTWVGRVLRLRPVVFIGLISYSLYLWHWPIIVFTKYRALEPLTYATAALLVLVSFIIASVSWKWVEQPFRKKAHLEKPGKIILTGMSAMGCIVIAGIAVMLADGFPQRLSPQQQRYASMVDKTKYFDIYDRGHCFLDYRQMAGDYKAECAEFTEGAGRIKVLIYGDSYAAHLYPGLLGKPGIEVRQYTATSCRPFLVGKQRCDAIYEHFFSAILPRSPADVLIVSGSWSSFYEKLGAKEFSSRLRKTLLRIKQYGKVKQLILVGQSPAYSRAVPYMMIIQDKSSDFYIPAKNAKALNAELREIAGQSGVSFVDFYDWACKGNVCPAALQGEPLHWDVGHMTRAGSEYYGQPLVESILRSAGSSVPQAVTR